MNKHVLLVGVVVVIIGGGAFLWQRPAGVGSDMPVEIPTTTAAPAPVPRTPWGEPDLSGVWRAPALGARDGQDTFNLAALEQLYTDDARALMGVLSPADDPALRCSPPAYPRAAMFGHRIQIAQRPDFAYVLSEAYQTWRSIPTNGRPHTESEYLYPTYLGDSTAHWDGDTLVVDVISFNGDVWLAGPSDRPTATSTGVWPTSGELHVVERWRRVDADTLEYQATVEDPAFLTGAWETPTVTFERQAVDRISEVMCWTEDGAATYLNRLD